MCYCCFTHPTPSRPSCLLLQLYTTQLLSVSQVQHYSCSSSSLVKLYKRTVLNTTPNLRPMFRINNHLLQLSTEVFCPPAWFHADKQGCCHSILGCHKLKGVPPWRGGIVRHWFIKQIIKLYLIIQLRYGKMKKSSLAPK